jgi:TolA-binding protein
MNRYLLLFVIVSCLSSEPSAFDAGRLDVNKPYGLTESEKYILDTNNRLQDINKEVWNLKNQVNRLTEQQEGLLSVLDGINSKIVLVGENIHTNNENSNLSIEKLNIDLKNLQDYVKESRELETTNQNHVRTILAELASIVDKINSNYITLEKRVFDLENKKNTNIPIVSGSSDLKSIASEELLQNGEKLFETKNYNGAKLYFQELISRNHKPARSSFMLGEIAYFNENWNEAIIQYKKSVGLYDKADYMPKLLYHTAISFDKISDTTSANQFYKLLKSSYPDSKEAKASPNR